MAITYNNNPLEAEYQHIYDYLSNLLEIYRKESPNDSGVADFERLLTGLEQAYKDKDWTNYKYYLESFGKDPITGQVLSSNYMDLIDQYIENQRVDIANAIQTEARDTSLLSSADQLQQLGISPSSVLSVGGASSGISSALPFNVNQQYSSMSKQQDFAKKMGLASSLIKMVGGMASSGIGGAAYGAARGALARIGMKTAQAALKANTEAEVAGQMKNLNKDELLNQIDLLNSQNPNYLG